MSDQQPECDLCSSKVDNDDDLTRLNLYVFGSEGIRVCYECRMTLTHVAARLREATGRAYLNGVKRGKGGSEKI